MAQVKKDQFNIGDLVCKRDQEWGEAEPFTVQCIHLADFRYGHGRALNYSSGFYEWGYDGKDLMLFEEYVDDFGRLKRREVQKVTRWVKIKSRFAQFRSKLPWNKKWRNL